MTRSPRTAVYAALACLIGLGVTLLLAYFAPPFTGRDAATLQGFIDLNRPHLTPLLSHVAHIADPAPYALVGLALALVALARGRGRVALAIGAVVLLAPLTSETLKPLLSHPRHQEWLGDGQIAAASWPSGHATAAMTLALCAVLAVPARWRPAAAAAGGLFSLAVSYAILVLGWHFPSDVIGGFLVAGLWTSLAVGAISLADERRPQRTRVPRAAKPSLLSAGAPAALVGGAAAAALAIAATHPHTVASYAAEHPVFLLGAAAIAGLAALLTAVASAVTRQP